MLKKILIGLGSFAAAFWLAHLSARLIVRNVLSCSMPCRWDDENGYGDCAPLEAHLEVKTTPEPDGHDVAIWYRATVTNRTCQTIRIDSDFFEQNKRAIPSIDANSGPRITIVDSNGKAVSPAPYKEAEPGIENVEREIHPYIYDLSEVNIAHETRRSESNPTWFFEKTVVAPGASIAASPSILAPYRLLMRTYSNERYTGTADVPTPVHMKDAEKRFATPPPGFRRLVEYRLSRKGRYTAQFKVDELLMASFELGRPGTLSHRIKKGLHILATPLGYRDMWGVEAHVSSPPVRFEVDR